MQSFFIINDEYKYFYFDDINRINLIQEVAKKNFLPPKKFNIDITLFFILC